MRERFFASLVTRLTLAVLAVLLLSLGVTTVVFITQLHESDVSSAASALRQINLPLARYQIGRALLNASAHPQTPLAGLNPATLGADRIMITSWPDDQVVGDTGSDGGKPDPALFEPINYDLTPHVHFRRQDHAPLRINGIDYVYWALPRPELYNPTPASAVSYHTVLILKRVPTLSSRAWQILLEMAQAGAVAVAISLLAAFVVLRRMTLPLLAMTQAAENMAGGDYDQQVGGASAKDEIGRLARAFNRMAYEVKRAREAQRQFVANVSHDLRSPLTSIIGFSQVLTEDPAITPQQRHIATIIHDEAQRLYRLTMDLLDLSRLEAGRLPLSRRPLDLTPLLRAIAARYEALPNKRNIHFSAEVSGAPLPLIGDPDRLTQIIVNLLDNALKFCNAGGEVRLRSWQQDNTALIEVYNTGAGIPPEDLPRVFDRFYRGDHSRAQKTGGSGIGLAIVRELVHAHGGEVTADSTYGAWAALTVRLPLAGAERFTEDLQAANSEAIDVPL